MIGSHDPFDCKDDHDFYNKVAAEISRMKYSLNQVEKVMDIYLKSVTNHNKGDQDGTGN